LVRITVKSVPKGDIARLLEMKEAASFGGLFFVREIGDYQRRP
jgi:hypothetical protein